MLWCFSAIDVLLVVFCCWAIEVFNIAIDNLMGHGLPLQFDPINFAAGHLWQFRLVTFLMPQFKIFTWVSPCYKLSKLLMMGGLVQSSQRGYPHHPPCAYH